ncbi:hypothetical protein C0585_07940 [Candidatus Woesearchaeota archaeon]|nr:MAG: hypothetical protein C0585_07940 [Candidatus Woesearchaeota archaeon]
MRNTRIGIYLLLAIFLASFISAAGNFTDVVVTNSDNLTPFTSLEVNFTANANVSESLDETGFQIIDSSGQILYAIDEGPFNSSYNFSYTWSGQILDSFGELITYETREVYGSYSYFAIEVYIGGDLFELFYNYTDDHIITIINGENYSDIGITNGSDLIGLTAVPIVKFTNGSEENLTSYTIGDEPLMLIYDSSLTYTLNLVSSDNVSGFYNLSNGTVTVIYDMDSPYITWNNPSDNNSNVTAEEIILLNTTITHNNYPGLSYYNYTISCSGSSNGTLGNVAPPQTINSTADYILANWTVPAFESEGDSCNITVEVIEGAEAQGFSTQVVNIMTNEEVTIEYFETFYEGDNITYFSNMSPMIFLEINVTNTSNVSVNLTPAYICSGQQSAGPYNSSTGTFVFACNINASAFSEGEVQELQATAFLTSYPMIFDTMNFTFVADFSEPEIEFESWLTTNIDGNPITFADYRDLITNPDIFFSPIDHMINFRVNATDNISEVMGVEVNITEAFGLNRSIAEFISNTTSGGSCTDLMMLDFNETSGFWEGNCSFGTDFTYENISSFTGGDEVASFNVMIFAYDVAGNMFAPFGVEDMFPINIHDLGEVGEDEDCMIMGSKTTNLNNETDFNDINLIVEVEMNMSCEFGLPYSEYEPVFLANFSSVDFSNPEAAAKIGAIFDQIYFDIAQQGSFNSSYIYVNSSAIAELNISAIVEFYHLPFASAPNVTAQANAAGLNGSVTWVQNPSDPVLMGMPSGNLTFQVLGFSGYDISDNTDPILTVTNPIENYNTSDSSVMVNITFNGTGTGLSTFVVNEIVNGAYNMFPVATNDDCVNQSLGSDIWYCGFEYLAVANGTVILIINGTDMGGSAPGNLGTTNVTFTVDQVDPVTSYTPPVGWQTTDVDVNLTTIDVHILVDYTTYSTDGGNTWTNDTDFTLSADGNYTVVYYSVDIVGNNETPHVINILVDQTQPSTTDDYLDGVWQTSDFNITLSATDATSNVSYINYTIDLGGVVQVMGDSVIILINESGNHTITYKAVDNAGNVESVITIYALLDKVDPVTSYTAPTGWQNTDVDVNLTVTEVDSGKAFTTYSTNGGNTWTNGTDFTLNSSGNYTVVYYSVDNAGNVEDNITINILIDKTKPTTGYINPGITWQSTPYNATLIENDTFSGVNYTMYSVDSAPEQSGTSIEISATGNYSITYYSVDYAGNIQDNVTLNALLDVDGPTTDSNAPVAWQTTDFLVSLNPVDPDSGVNHTTYFYDGTWYNDSTNPYMIVINVEGNNTLTYYAVDNVGNIGSNTTEYVALDKSSPITNTIGVPTDWVSSATIIFNATDAVSGLAYTNYSIDNGVWVTNDSVTFLATGNYSLRYFSVDYAGNNNSIQEEFILIDVTAPNSSDDYSGTGWQTTSQTVTIDSDDAHSDVASTTINGVVRDNITLSTTDNHSVTYYSTDNAGNVENSTTIYVAVDVDEPVISGNTPIYTNDVTPTISVALSDVGSGINTTTYFIELNNGTQTQYDNTNCGAKCNVSSTALEFYQDTNLTEGVYEVTVKIDDFAGNQDEVVWNMTIDLTAPNVTFTMSDTSYYLNDATSYSCTGTDEYSGNLTGTVTGLSTSTTGTRTATCTVTDDAGNEATETISYEVERRPSSSSGGGSYTPPPSDVLQTTYIDSLPAGTVTVSFSKDTLELVGIEIGVGEDLEGVKITGKSLLEKPGSLPELNVNSKSKKVFKYLEIVHSNLDNEDVTEATITFKVPKSWVEANADNPQSIMLYRFTETWKELVTTFLREEGDNYIFSADSPGMSYFAIGVNDEVLAEPSEETDETTTEETVEESVEETGEGTEEVEVAEGVDEEVMPEEESKGFPWMIVGGILLIVIILGAIIFINKKD